MTPVTPIQEFPALASILGLSGRLWLKREDLHPYGSHKGRSIPVMIDRYIAEGKNVFAISSSGNAALAAAIYISDLNEKISDRDKKIQLEIFVGQNISPHKLERLERVATDRLQYVKITKTDRPLQALMLAIEEGATSLRQSTDDTALIGYASLAQEIALIPDLKAIFIGTSSGTSAQALAQYFLDKKDDTQIHIVQTTSCHPMSDEWNIETTRSVEKDITSGLDDSELSIADAIVDKTAMRKTALTNKIRETGGSGWIATNADIKTAQEIVKQRTDLDISTNSALSIVGLQKALNRDTIKASLSGGSVVCIICGE